jgi:quercetin 2,3-dioxygenase
VQLWVNLPGSLTMTGARYESVTRDTVRLPTSDDGGTLVRLITGDIAAFSGPGSTHTPITYAHATLAPAGARRAWSPRFAASVYVLTGRGAAGAEGRPVEAGQLVVFGPGDHLALRATDRPSEQFDVLPLGGLPIREPVVHHGGFAMNTRREIVQALEDFQAGRLGVVPGGQIAPRKFS